MKHYFTLLLAVSINVVVCRDFYVGMFKKNDILVAQDRVYKERVPYRIQYAKYGRHFRCAITYFRVVDRLGYGPGPKVVITRGGLRKKYIVLRIQSMYNQPISVNIYVGCENRMRSTTRRRPTTTTHAARDGEHTTTEGGSESKDNSTESGTNTAESGGPGNVTGSSQDNNVTTTSEANTNNTGNTDLNNTRRNLDDDVPFQKAAENDFF